MSAEAAAAPHTHTYKQPLRYIFDAADHAAFLASPAYAELTKFVAAISHAVTDQSSSADVHLSEGGKVLIAMLEEASKWIDEIPPLQQQMRYGNKAYRTWHARLMHESSSMCARLLAHAHGHGSAGAEVELVPYFCDSFGNATRIDYGTGHETEFIIFLCALAHGASFATVLGATHGKCTGCADVLARVGVLQPTDLAALGCKVFPAYLRVCRKLQRTYWLEPAGSHGVWSLDDYQFLVFLFGSAQLLNHKHIKPKSIHNTDILEGFAHEYMYLGAVQFISSVKQGAPFAEHSPMLNDIAELPTWAKVNEGLMKLYKTEVLGKLPVVQHLVFGTLFSANWTPSRTPVPSEAMAHALAEAAKGTAHEAAAEAIAARAAEHVPVDEPEMTVAPWVTRPLPPQATGLAPATLTGVAPWARTAATAAPASSGMSSADAFLAAFGNVPHAAPHGRRGSHGGESPASPSARAP